MLRLTKVEGKNSCTLVRYAPICTASLNNLDQELEADKGLRLLSLAEQPTCILAISEASHL